MTRRFAAFRLLLVLSFCNVALAQPRGTFAPTGNMLTPRWGHTATLLPDGKVLIAGGDSSCSLIARPQCIPAAGAELYDPETATFVNAGAMNTIHPVGGILLPNDKVLFAEGYSTGVPASVELYDPSSGEFKIAGASVSLTSVTSAALLNDGRVLLIGYSRYGPPAEIYDTAAEASAPVPNWPAGLVAFSILSVLQDGRVLFDAPALFDPRTSTFTPTQNFFSAFDNNPSANLLLGGNVLLTGGNINGQDLNWSEVFYSVDESIWPTLSMSFARAGHTATLLPDGEVLVAGGVSGFNFATHAHVATDSAEIYDPANGAYSLTGSMTAPRFEHAAVLLKNGQVLVTGGQLTSPPEGPNRFFAGSSTAELYTPAALIPAPVLFSLSGDGRGRGAIWRATGEIVSTANPASLGEVLSMYTTSLVESSVIAPQVAVGGRPAEVLFFGPVPQSPGYYQVNFRVPRGVDAGPDVPVRLTYIGRPSNEVTISVQ
jgi:hypothetical protein